MKWQLPTSSEKFYKWNSLMLLAYHTNMHGVPKDLWFHFVVLARSLFGLVWKTIFLESTPTTSHRHPAWQFSDNCITTQRWTLFLFLGCSLASSHILGFVVPTNKNLNNRTIASQIKKKIKAWKQRLVFWIRWWTGGVHDTIIKLHIDKVAIKLGWQTSAVLVVESYRSICICMMSCA